MTKSNTIQDKILFRSTVFRLLEDINTPRSLGLFLRLRDGQKPIDVDIKPIEYLDAARYLEDVQALALIKKNPWFFDKDNETSARALDKFLEAESRCFITNSYFRYSNFRHDCLKDVRSVLECARNIARDILGEFSYGQCDFGPGSSLSLGGVASNIVSKLKTKPECTALAYTESYSLICEQIPHYAISCGILERTSRSITVADTPNNIVKGNRFSTVPKDWKTDRPICVEPLGNMLLQKSIGASIRDRLKKFGLDLNVVPVLHGEYVRRSSVLDCYSTIDLASASDTIAFELVKSILPCEWFDKLNKARSHYTELPSGDSLYNEKFSSMGNGFTFELESLLFYVLGLAIRRLYGKPSDLVSVFGDDIVVEQYLFDKMVLVLTTCGFSINYEKSFRNGSFFESCGYDYFNGLPVRPIYLKDIYDKQRITTFYCMANRVRQVAHRISFNTICDSRFLSTWQSVLRGLPKSLHFYGPAEYGDNVLLSPRSDWNGDTSFGYLRIKSWRRVYRGIKPSGGMHHELACALYGVPSRGVNSRVCNYQIKATFVSPSNGDPTLGWF